MRQERHTVRAERLDDTRVRVDAGTGLDIRLFASRDVPIDRSSLAEVAAVAGVAETAAELSRAGFMGDAPVGVRRAVLTPDFHKGAGIPVGLALETEGFVLPRCPGTDIGCGMRLVATDVTREEFARCRGLDPLLRHAFFEGGRDVALDEAGRAAVLREGLPGLRPPPGGGGLWRRIDPQQLEADLDRAHRRGSWPTADLWAFEDFVRGSGGVSRDAALGSIGGGNHFLEVQWVEECVDRRACWEWGLRPGTVAVMVHTGSVGLGSLVGKRFADRAREIWPRGVAVPAHGFLPLPTTGPHAAEGRAYLSAMGLAANFAAANRLVLSALAVRCLSDALGREVSGRLVWDAPHNVVWDEGGRHLHRKGATPAERDESDPLFPGGAPVIVPGSMGDASWLLKGCGSDEALRSAPHGAGRLAARGEGRKGDPGEVERLRVVTRVDPRATRRDVAAELRRGLLEEAPSQYKPVGPVIDTVAAAGIAAPVARLRPLLTVKG